MPTGPEIMKAAAVASGCSHQPYSQMDSLQRAGVDADMQGGKGICFGLAVTWLESQMAGTGGDFARKAGDWQGSAVFARSHLMWINQNSEMWSKLAGLKAATDKDGDSKFAYFDAGDEADMKKLADWIGNANGSRYFMLSITHKHAMAACGSRTGELKFFDPNSGTMSTRFAGKLAKGMLAYFSDPKIKNAYKNRTNRVELDVTKYKAA